MIPLVLDFNCHRVISLMSSFLKSIVTISFCFLLFCLAFLWSTFWYRINMVWWDSIKSTIIDSWYQKGKWYAKFIPWYCTDYAASRRPDIFPSAYGSDRSFGGSAIERYTNAHKVGIVTGKKPKVWAIIVFAHGAGASTSDWHVGIVEAILDNHKIEITDMNYLWRHIITKRIVDDRKSVWYIYTRKDKEIIVTSLDKTSILLSNKIEETKNNIYLTLNFDITSWVNSSQLWWVSDSQSFFVLWKLKNIPDISDRILLPSWSNTMNSSEQLFWGWNKKKMLVLDKRKKSFIHFLSQKVSYDLIHQSIIISIGVWIIRLEHPSWIV